MKSFLLFATACFCTQADTFAQGTLRGVVRDASAGAVAHARVNLTERLTKVTRSAESDAAGAYSFENLAPSEYWIEASSEGFGATAPKLIRLTESSQDAVDLEIEPARVVTQVQVTAAGIAQTVDEQAKAMDVVDMAQIERRQEFSIAEAIRTVPGIRVEQLGGPGSLVRVLTRGMRASDTSFLIDGFRLRDAASPQGDATAYLSDLLVTDLDRVEVLRGSGSSLYGTHATGGVVNVITDQGGGQIRGDISTEGGGLGLFRGTARMSGGALRDRLRFSGGITHLNVSNGVDGNDRARNTTAQSFGQFQLTDKTFVSGRILFADAFAQLNSNPFLGTNGLFVPAPDDPDARRSAQTKMVLVSLRQIFTPSASVQVHYSGLGTSRDTRDGPGGQSFQPLFNNSNVFDGRIDTVQARTDIALGRYHVVTAGYEFERENFDNHSTDQNPDPAGRTDARVRIHEASHSGFVQAQGRYFDGRLQVLASGRIQRFDLSLPEFSGNNPLYQGVPIETPPDALTGDGSIAWTIARSSTKFRAHVGNGYRAPSLYERFGASFFSGRFSAYGDPRLRPERLLSVDGGVDQYFARNRVRMAATYFYTQLQESIVFNGGIRPATDPFGRFGGYDNGRGGLARGAELSIEAAPTRTLSIQGSYTFTKALDRASQYGTTELRAPRISEHMFSAVATQRIGRQFEVTFDFFAASSYLFPLYPVAYRFDGPVRGDLSAAWTRPLTERQSIRLFTRVENVFNRTYYEEGFPTPKAWAVGGVKWMF